MCHGGGGAPVIKKHERAAVLEKGGRRVGEQKSRVETQGIRAALGLAITSDTTCTLFLFSMCVGGAWGVVIESRAGEGKGDAPIP